MKRPSHENERHHAERAENGPRGVVAKTPQRPQAKQAVTAPNAYKRRNGSGDD